jgi:mannose-1-phosphate guanylyltransferase
MKAILLAAGLGTRLRPLTSVTPKCLVPFGGKPLLDIWLELLREHGFTSVLINTHHLHGQVEKAAEDWRGTPELHLTHEPTLLGSLGTLQANREFVQGQENVLVCNGDNLTDIDLTQMRAFHREHDGVLTMALFRPPDLRSCGVVELAEDGRITSFEEKPRNPRGEWANAGVYLIRTSLWDQMQSEPPADIGRDLLPACVGKMFGWKWDGFLQDIGTREAYARAQESWVGLQATATRESLA